MLFQEKTIFAAADAKERGHSARVCLGLHPHPQDDHVRVDALRLPKEGILTLDHQPPVLAEHPAHLAVDKGNPLLLDPVAELFVPLAKRSEIPVYLADLGARALPHHVGQLQGVHAAYPGAVDVVLLVPAPHAVQDRHPLGGPAVAEAYLALGRPAGVDHPLELETREHVVVYAVPILGRSGGIKGFKARG